jgi:hypothetical protein
MGAMGICRSRLGLIMSLVYLAGATYVAWDAFRHTGGGWINLRGMGVLLVTAPSQLSFGLLFEFLRMPPVNYAEPGWAGYGQVAFHIFVTAAVVYLIGCAIGWLVLRLRAAVRRSSSRSA